MFDLKDYIQKGFKFIIVGAIGSVVNLGLLYFFTKYFGLYYIWSEVLAILIAFAVNYNGNILLKNINIEKNGSSSSSSKPVTPSPGVMEAEKVEDMTSAKRD